MAVYRVGAEGATVFNEDGGVVARLRPGHVVVPGVVETSGSAASQHRAMLLDGRRVRGYADKRLAPADYDDKAG
jgi:hypothetical protein